MLVFRIINIFSRFMRMLAIVDLVHKFKLNHTRILLELGYIGLTHRYVMPKYLRLYVLGTQYILGFNAVNKCRLLHYTMNGVQCAVNVDLKWMQDVVLTSTRWQIYIYIWYDRKISILRDSSFMSIREYLPAKSVKHQITSHDRERDILRIGTNYFVKKRQITSSVVLFSFQNTLGPFSKHRLGRG